MNTLKEISESLGVEASSFDAECWGFAAPLILKLQGEGASFLIKADGERSSNIFTLMIEGGSLGEDYLRCETDNLHKGISQILSDYAQQFWN